MNLKKLLCATLAFHSAGIHECVEEEHCRRPRFGCNASVDVRVLGTSQSPCFFLFLKSQFYTKALIYVKDPFDSPSGSVMRMEAVSSSFFVEVSRRKQRMNRRRRLKNRNRGNFFWAVGA